jgi:signal transduction histidine kinase
VSAETHNATILIVDDTPINLRVIVESLEDRGYRIVVTARGEEALKRADYVQPDLVLLDVLMPDLNGFEICRRLKAQPGTRDIPVIFMTSLASVCLRKVQFASQRMDVLIQDSLTYARTGRGSVRAIPVPLLPLVRELECTFGERVAAANARIRVSQPLATPLGDPTLIEQILLNPIDNALKYRRREAAPELRLSATATGEQVRVQLADNGIGMLPEYPQKIFQVFQRLHHEHEYPGTGIGLAIVAKAARAMGGEVTVTSSPGQGSTCSLRLPAALSVEPAAR